MKRFVCIGVASLLAAALLAVGGAAPAGAHSTFITEPIVDPTYASEVPDLVKQFMEADFTPTPSVVNPAQLTLSDITDGEVATGMLEAAGEGGAIAAIPGVDVVAGGAVLDYSVWKLSSSVFEKVFSDDTSSTAYDVQWICVDSTGNTPSCNGSTSAGGFAAGSGGNCDQCSVLRVAGQISACTTWSGSCNLWPSTQNDYYAAFAGAGTTVSYSYGCGLFGTDACYTIYRTLSDQLSHLRMEPATSTDYSSAPSDAQVDWTGKTIATPDLSAIQTALGTSSAPADTTPAQAAARCAIDAALVPGYDCNYIDTGGAPPDTGSTPSPTVVSPAFLIPEPLPDEDYAAYKQRLRDLGYLGTIERVDEDMSAYPEGSYAARLNPGSVTHVRVGTADPVEVYDFDTGTRTEWLATTDDLVVPGTTTLIKIGAVPATYDPIGTGGASGPGDTTGAGGGAGGGGACPCSLHSLDFSAITIAPACTKFPFGVFCWLGGVVDDLFSAPEEAPHVTIDSYSFGTFMGVNVELPTLTYDFADLPVSIDNVIGLMREVFGFMLWVGGVWYVGTRLLGRDEAPDMRFGEEMGD